MPGMGAWSFQKRAHNANQPTGIPLGVKMGLLDLVTRELSTRGQQWKSGTKFLCR